MQHLEVSGAVRHICVYIYIYVNRRLKVKFATFDLYFLHPLSPFFHMQTYFKEKCSHLLVLWLSAPCSS